MKRLSFQLFYFCQTRPYLRVLVNIHYNTDGWNLDKKYRFYSQLSPLIHVFNHLEPSRSSKPDPYKQSFRCQELSQCICNCFAFERSVFQTRQSRSVPHCCYLRASCGHCFFSQTLRVKFTSVDVLILCFSEKLPAAGNLAFIFRGQ